MNEIIVKRPGLPIKFEVIKKNDFNESPYYWGNLYIDGKLIKTNWVGFFKESQRIIVDGFPLDLFNKIKDQLPSHKEIMDYGSKIDFTITDIKNVEITDPEGLLNEIIVKRPSLSIKFEITKKSDFNFYHGNLYINGKLMDTVHAVLNTKHQDLTIQDFPLKLYNEIKDKLPYYIEYQSSEDNGVYFEIKDIENIQVVDPKKLLKEIKVKRPSALKFEVTNRRTGFLPNEFFGNLYLYDELLDDNTFLSLAKSMVAEISKETYDRVKDQLPPHEILDEYEGKLGGPDFGTYLEVLFDDIKDIKIVDELGLINEIKINTPGIKAQVYSWEASPERKLFYDKIATQTYSLLSELAQELNYDVSNFRASFDGLYYGQAPDYYPPNQTALAIQIKSSDDTWKEPWTGNALIPQTVSGKALVLWSYNNTTYDKSEENPILSQLLPVIEEKNLIKIVSEFALKIKNSLTPEEVDLVAPNTPILVTGKSLKEITVNRPKPFRYKSLGGFGLLYFQGELLWKQALHLTGLEPPAVGFAVERSQYERLKEKLAPYAKNISRDRDLVSMQVDDTWIYFVDGIQEIKVNQPNIIEKQLYSRILSLYPEATMVKSRLYGHIIYLFPNSKIINKNSIIVEPSGVMEVHLGDDIKGRRFKHINNLIKYVEDNPVEASIDEITVNRPSLFKFKIERKGFSDVYFGKFYLSNNLVDDDAVYNAYPGYNHIHFYLDKENPKFEKLTNLLKANNIKEQEPFSTNKRINYVIESDKVVIVDDLNEIKVLPPSKHFTFNDDKAYRIVGGKYKVVGEDEDDYKLQNIKTKEIIFVGKHYAKTNNISEIKVKTPNSSIRFEASRKNPFFDMIYGNIYLNDTLLNDYAHLMREEGSPVIYFSLPLKTYETIENSLPPHEVENHPDDIVGITFKNLNNVKIINKLNEIKVNAPKPFLYDGYYYDENDNSTEGELYFNGELLDDDAVYIYGVSGGNRIYYITFNIKTPVYIRLFDQLSPYVKDKIIGGSIKRTLDQITSYPDDYQHTLIIKDLSKVNLKSLPPFIDEIKINKPGKPFKFKIEEWEESNESYFGKLYFNNKLLDDTTVYYPNTGNNVLKSYIVFELPLPVDQDLQQALLDNGAKISIQRSDRIFYGIKDLNNVDIVDTHGLLSEIKIGVPGWKNFNLRKVVKRFDDTIFTLSLDHPELRSTYFVYYKTNENFVTWVWNIEYKQDIDEKERLVNLLSKYDKPFELIPEFGFVKIPLSLINMSQSIGEIKVNIPGKVFKFKTRAPLGDGLFMGDLYFNNKIIDSNAFYNKKSLVNSLAFILSEPVYQSLKNEIDPYVIEIRKDMEYDLDEVGLVFIVDDLNSVLFMDDNINEIKISTPNWKNIEAELVDEDNEIEIFEFTHPESDLVWYGHRSEGSDVFNIEFGDADEAAHEEHLAQVLIDLLSKYNKSYKRIDHDDEMFWIQIPKNIVTVIDENIDEIKISTPGWKNFTLTKHNDHVNYNTISITLKHPELRLHYFGYWDKNKDYIIWPFDDWDEEEGHKAELTNLLDKYNKSYKIVNDAGPDEDFANSYIKIPLSLIDVEVNEITINKPKTKFEFPLMINNQEEYDFYTNELLKSGKRWFVNYIDGTPDDISSISWPYIGPDDDKFPFCIKTNYHNPEVIHAIPYSACKKLTEIKVQAPKNIIPLKFKKILTDHTGWRDGVIYSIDVEGFPETSVTIHDDEPDVVYLYPGQYAGDIKTKLDMLSIPYESLVNNILVDKKYFSNYEIN